MAYECVQHRVGHARHIRTAALKGVDEGGFTGHHQVNVGGFQEQLEYVRSKQTTQQQPLAALPIGLVPVLIHMPGHEIIERKTAAAALQRPQTRIDGFQRLRQQRCRHVAEHDAVAAAGRHAQHLRAIGPDVDTWGWRFGPVQVVAAHFVELSLVSETLAGGDAPHDLDAFPHCAHAPRGLDRERFQRLAAAPDDDLCPAIAELIQSQDASGDAHWMGIERVDGDWAHADARAVLGQQREVGVGIAGIQ